MTLISQWIFVYQYLKMASLMPFLLRQQDDEEGKKSFNGLTTKLGLFNWGFIILATGTCVVNVYFTHDYTTRLLPLIPYMILIGCLTYAVCKIKKIVAE